MQCEFVFYLLYRFKDEKFMMQLRDNNTPHFPNRWCVPGGSVEIGEQAGAAVHREVKEETTLSLRRNECLYIFDFKFRKVDRSFGNSAVYLAYRENPQILCMEGQRMEWFTKTEVMSLTLASNGKALFVEMLKCWGHRLYTLREYA
jgi:8-oxo-dGTP diphosphatase